jgi:argininosuccinate lyase
VDTVKLCVPVFAAMIRTMRVLPENMLAAAKRGFINATDAADYLTKKGVPFRDAYKAVGQLVYTCTTQGKTLEQLTLEEFRAIHPEFDEGIYEAIDLQTCVAQRLSHGGPSVPETTRQIEELTEFVKEHR